MSHPVWHRGKLIEALVDEGLYHTAKIIKHCDDLGLFDYSFDYPDRRLTPQEKEHAMKKARSSLSTFASKYLPEADGYSGASHPPKTLYPAHYGKTWKICLAARKFAGKKQGR